MLDRVRARDEFFGPRDRLPLFDHVAQKCCVDGDLRRRVEVVMVGSPAKCCAEICKLADKPVASVTLLRTVPDCHYISLAPCKVAGGGGGGGVGSRRGKQVFFR